MPELTFWERVKLGSKNGLERSLKAFDKPTRPGTRRSINKLSAEAFWPTTLEKECDRAARILKSFCIDGFNAEEDFRAEDGTKQTRRVLKKIPASVIRDAKALAIFTTMRNGLWLTAGAGGSGVLIAQKDDGSWSPPSTILVHTAALGFLPGIDLYDCVVVINTQEALEAFYNVRYTLGSEVNIEAGPLTTGEVSHLHIHQRHAPLLTYLKSRGFYTGVQIDGTIIVERADENESFYGQRMTVEEIVNGWLQHPPSEVQRLLQTLKAAQGDLDFDASALPVYPPPADFEVSGGQVFGLPDKMDPDPYGVLALEKEGMNIVEAGSKQRASWEQFSFCPSPTSPVHSMYARSNADYSIPPSRGGSWRGSTTSNASQSFIRPNSMRRSADSRLRISTTFRPSTQERLSDETPNSGILTWRNGLDRQSSRASASPNVWPTAILRDSVMEDDFFDKDASTAPTPSAYLTPPSTPPSEREDVSLSSNASHDAGDLQPAKHGVQVLGSSVAPIVAKATLVDIPKRALTSTPPHSPESVLEQDFEMHTPSPDSLPSPAAPKPMMPESKIVDAALAALLESEGKAMQQSLPDATVESSVSDIQRHVSTNSTSSGTWEKIRALRAIDDDDDGDDDE